MNERKKTIEEVAQIVEQEGLDYAIQHYLHCDSIEDPDLAKAWAAAGAALITVDQMLESYYE